jgi:FtsP/CotA-like multicopper oxidase with cupredoxin domain
MQVKVRRLFQNSTLRCAAALFLAGSLFSSHAYAHGGGEEGPFPPEGDPSAFTGPVSGDLPDDLPEANEGTFEGGETGTHLDAEEMNVLPKEEQRDGGEDQFGVFNVPSNGAPSPLFGAESFTQQMLRFEEFGTDKLRLNANKPDEWKRLPRPADAQSTPKSRKLDRFLAQDPWPVPTKFANDNKKNPWRNRIEEFIGRPLDNPPAEGRPPGLGWSHQRWEEFTPERYFQTAQAGARTNRGLRDHAQLHKYRKGEFGKGGLYHNTAGAPGFGGTTAGIEIKFHPNMPIQDHTTLWTFDGTFPPKLLNVRYGEPVLMRHYNALPIDVAANRGFGVHTITTHEHNGHSPAESDGYANAFFFPGQFYDYRWPLPLAGHDSINTRARDRRAGRPDGHGGIEKIPGDWRETMSTHWFHDHMLDYTAQNVYKGNAAMMNYYSALDRGNESIRDGVNLRLPSGDALDWGNRDYDVNLLLAEKAWDSEGQLWFNPFNIKGFIGDVMTVNWLYDPYLEVRARRYRFRILNGSVSRYFKVALVDEAGNRVPFHMVANDGNLMEHTVHFENGELPTQGIAERYDIVVDFSNFEPGDKLYFVNLLQHQNGQVTDVPIPLEDILSGEYQPVAVDDNGDGTADRWVDGDPVVGKFLEFRVKKYRGTDRSMNPAKYEEGGKTMIPLRQPTEDQLANALHRTFEFERQPTDDKPWVIETDGGKGVGMDPRRLSAAPSKNSPQLEVWRLLNSGTWSHPVHIHFEEGILLRRGGVAPPEWEKWARKDVYRLGPQPDSTNMVEIALRFREFAGTYMEHCHNTQHEDHAMLLRWDIEHPGQVKLMPTPIPSWDGVAYVDSAALPTARTGDDVGEFGPSLDSQAVEIWVEGVEVEVIDLVNVEIGDGLRSMNGESFDDERTVAKVPLTKGVNIDSNGVERDVWFVLHDLSDEALAEEFGVAWAGGIADTPEAGSSAASYDNGEWTFFGDLPNPISFGPGHAAKNGELGIPAQSAANTYSPLRRVTIDGQDVLVNAFFINWGDEFWEQLRVDVNCVVPDDFPDDPPNTSCRYNGDNWGLDSAHALEIDITAPEPFVRMKLHKSWTDNGDYLPYYIVVDSFPAGPANNMGVPYVPKHQFLGRTAVPLVQFVPGEVLSGGYPPFGSQVWKAGQDLPAGVNVGDPIDISMNIRGGGPMGGQIGLPSYFMPEANYSPYWHIGFTHWTVDDPSEVVVVKGLEQLEYLRAQGKLMIHEWPGIRLGENDYDLDAETYPHVVNCPTPVTIDAVVHSVNRKIKQEMAGQ